MLAVKKAHRQWIDEKRNMKDREAESKKISTEKKDTSKENPRLDFGAVARKLVRRTPDKASLEELGKALLKNLSREMEIMSGIFYLRKKGSFVAIASYALASHSEPYTFKEGEGLTGRWPKTSKLWY